MTLAQEAELRSKIYMLLSTFYVLRPRADFVKRLKDTSFREVMGNVAEESSPMNEGLRVLQAFVNSIKDMPEDVVAEDLAIDFTRLMRGIKEGYGPPQLLPRHQLLMNLSGGERAESWVETQKRCSEPIMTQA